MTPIWVCAWLSGPAWDASACALSISASVLGLDHGGLPGVLGLLALRPLLGLGGGLVGLGLGDLRLRWIAAVCGAAIASM
jgi:hypothetical protein